jgi:hypothetical protein
MICVGSFGHEKETIMEENTVEKHSKHARREDPSLLSSTVGKMKTTHSRTGNNNV